MNMKRKLALALCLALLLSLCAACGGQRGWVYDLPNGYALHCVDGQVCVEQNGEQALSYNVTAFCAGSRYVGIRQEAGSEDGTETYWFLLDTENQTFYAEESEEDFRSDCESFQVTDLGDWIETASRPDGAHAA